MLILILYNFSILHQYQSVAWWQLQVRSWFAMLPSFTMFTVYPGVRCQCHDTMGFRSSRDAAAWFEVSSAHCKLKLQNVSEIVWQIAQEFSDEFYHTVCSSSWAMFRFFEWNRNNNVTCSDKLAQKTMWHAWFMLGFFCPSSLTANNAHLGQFHEKDAGAMMAILRTLVACHSLFNQNQEQQSNLICNHGSDRGSRNELFVLRFRCESRKSWLNMSTVKNHLSPGPLQPIEPPMSRGSIKTWCAGGDDMAFDWQLLPHLRHGRGEEEI